MKRFRGNLFLQFTLISFAVVASITLVLTFMLSSRLNHNLDHLKEHGVLMRSGQMMTPDDHVSIPSIVDDVEALRRVTYGATAGGFLILWVSLVLFIARASRTIKEHQESLARTNSELKVAATELSRSNTELEQFAYVASHDPQEPVRMVASYCQLLQRRYGDKVEQDGKEFIEFAVDGANRMQTLIQGLLTYSRAGRGLSKDPVNCESILEETTRSLSSTIAETGTVIRHEPLPTVRGDATQLAQVFQNLISNAIKYKNHRSPEIDITSSRQNGSWTVAFRDNGIGIASKHTERIFGIFERLHGVNEYAGTGIGLALCKKIVESHGGRIWVESQEGEGSTFYFTVSGVEQGAVSQEG